MHLSLSPYVHHLKRLTGRRPPPGFVSATRYMDEYSIKFYRWCSVAGSKVRIWCGSHYPRTTRNTNLQSPQHPPTPSISMSTGSTVSRTCKVSRQCRDMMGRWSLITHPVRRVEPSVPCPAGCCPSGWLELHVRRMRKERAGGVLVCNSLLRRRKGVCSMEARAKFATRR